MYSKACEGSPPLHPLLLKSCAQSTNCCSERRTIVPVLMAWADSRAPTVENVQQLPHMPWFLTIETHDVSPHVSLRQSFSVGSGSVDSVTRDEIGFVCAVAEQFCGELIRKRDLNSSHVRSEYAFTPACHVRPRWLISSISLSEEQKFCMRSAPSWLLPYAFLCLALKCSNFSAHRDTSLPPRGTATVAASAAAASKATNVAFMAGF
mmetsp:Transcript_48697/g.115948  ORF Transcript_48697/g.115948 Transcript_48697/m.115948 type:complete len:207 (+) Transcript_48697:540-1160(+)